MKKIIVMVLVVLMVLSLAAGAGAKDKTGEEQTQTIPDQNSIPIETVTADGFSMNYFRFGDGDKTLVILPGLSAQGVMGSAEQVASAYQIMTDEFTVYVFDPRTELPEAYSASDMAEDTVEVFKALGLDHVYIMGDSMGGTTAMEISIHHPELVEKMVLVSTVVKLEDEQFQKIDRWIRLAREGDVEGLYLEFGEDVYPEDVFEQSRDALIEASKTVTGEELKHFTILAESQRDFDITEDLDKIRCPGLVVSDKEDHVFGPGTTE